jgi:hypothetical protein
MTPRDPDRLIRVFLDQGETRLPDRAFDEVRGDIHRTRQRVVIGPWREPNMSVLTRVAIAAAAVLAIGLAWINLGSPPPTGVSSQPSPSATTPPSPSPSPPLVPDGAIKPGRYVMLPIGMVAAAKAPDPRLIVTMPAGWEGDQGGAFINKNYGVDAGPAMSAWQINGTFVNPCTDHTLVTPAPGPGVDALITALAHQPGTTAGQPVAVTIDGYRGKSVEVTVATDISKCGNGIDGFWLWASPDGDRRYVQDSGETDRIYVLDVKGRRFTFSARIPARTTAADRAELQAIIDSIQIAPVS